MQGLIVLLSVLQCSLISDALLEESFLSLPQAQAISRHHQQQGIWQARMCSCSHL